MSISSAPSIDSQFTKVSLLHGLQQRGYFSIRRGIVWMSRHGTVTAPQKRDTRGAVEVLNVGQDRYENDNMGGVA